MAWSEGPFPDRGCPFQQLTTLRDVAGHPGGGRQIMHKYRDQGMVWIQFPFRNRERIVPGLPRAADVARQECEIPLCYQSDCTVRVVWRKLILDLEGTLEWKLRGNVIAVVPVQECLKSQGPCQ